MKIDILLSTYNGEAFLEELLQSLENQTCLDWQLMVRDDGSSDKTLAILNSYRDKDRDRVLIINNKKKHLGPKNSFEVLLYESNADYIMFCDQDDVWMPDKIRISLDKVLEIEQQHPGHPVLVFSDLTVTDQNLKVLHPSLWKYTKVNPENIKNIYRLLINNPVVGCTVMINKTVKPLVLPIPERAVMHDWWIALNVAEKGKVGYLTQPTLLYRLHGNNSLGVSSAHRKYYFGRMFHFPTTLSQNINAIKMLKSLDFPLSTMKFLGYKFVIGLSKIFKK